VFTFVWCSRRSVALTVELTYSASVDESAGKVWALLLHVTAAPTIMNTYPLVDFRESISPAQSVLLKPWAIADKSLLRLPSYIMDRSCVPLR
jgi:hypothetical protein